VIEQVSSKGLEGDEENGRVPKRMRTHKRVGNGRSEDVGVLASMLVSVRDVGEAETSGIVEAKLIVV